MNLNKILGYILLAAGILLICWTIFQSYNIFTAKASPPLIFRTSASEKFSQKNANILDVQGQIQNALSQQIGQVLPADTGPKILNLSAWFILAGILIFGGSAIAGIGVKLIK